jgi:protein-S-isoprenylcysteine O-methyltransferase Ste14
VFLLVSAGLVYVSRASLFRPHSHGFYRFLSWEAILGLFLLNEDAWLREPFAPRQLVSWCLLSISACLVIYGALLLRWLGGQDARRDDHPLLEFEKTSHLVTIGAYRYIRHPMYSSLLFLAWGVFFKDPSLGGSLLALAASLCLVAAARVEEVEDLHYFGEAYRTYMERTKMFIPFLF